MTATAVTLALPLIACSLFFLCGYCGLHDARSMRRSGALESLAPGTSSEAGIARAGMHRAHRHCTGSWRALTLRRFRRTALKPGAMVQAGDLLTGLKRRPGCTF